MGQNIAKIPKAFRRFGELKVREKQNKMKDGRALSPLFSFLSLSYSYSLSRSYSYTLSLSSPVLSLAHLTRLSLSLSSLSYPAPFPSSHVLSLSVSLFQVMNLSGNGIEEIPKEVFRNTPLLEQLILQENKLTELPRSITYLRRLNVLRVANNALTSLPREIGRLKALTELLANNNKIEELPDTICDLQFLSFITITSNGLKRLPSRVYRMGALVKLYASKNCLETLPEDFGRLPKLEELRLASNRLRCLPIGFGAACGEEEEKRGEKEKAGKKERKGAKGSIREGVEEKEKEEAEKGEKKEAKGKTEVDGKKEKDREGKKDEFEEATKQIDKGTRIEGETGIQIASPMAKSPSAFRSRLQAVIGLLSGKKLKGREKRIGESQGVDGERDNEEGSKDHRGNPSGYFFPLTFQEDGKGEEGERRVRSVESRRFAMLANAISIKRKRLVQRYHSQRDGLLTDGGSLDGNTTSIRQHGGKHVGGVYERDENGPGTVQFFDESAHFGVVIEEGRDRKGGMEEGEGEIESEIYDGIGEGGEEEEDDDDDDDEGYGESESEGENDERRGGVKRRSPSPPYVFSTAFLVGLFWCSHSFLPVFPSCFCSLSLSIFLS